MTTTVVKSPAWPPRKWLVVICSLLFVHVGLIIWLARGEPASSTPAVRGPAILLVAGPAVDLAGLTDPTVLPLPNLHGASGPAWLMAPATDYQPTPWSGPPAWLRLQVGRLGGMLTALVRSNLSQPLEVAERPVPGLPGTSYYVQPELLASQPSFRVEGELAGRPLLSTSNLKTWPQADAILTASIVQIVVDDSGRVFFPPVLLPDGRSGSDEADAMALELARSASFQPLPKRGPQSAGSSPQHLTPGRLVFAWQTVPLPLTNGPAGAR